nr:ribonuclease H-like domain-containing protein [Tanacetum cinerariifolium]
MEGILRQFSVARTPQQNGVDERRNRTLIEAASTMLVDSKLPTTFWTEAVNTACYVQNRVLVVKPHNKTLYELFYGRTPTLSFMRPFGCHVTILNTIDHFGKFDGSEPNWQFDIDALTRTINYEPIVAGTQYNGFAGTKVSDNAGQTRKETEPIKDYILLSSWTVDLLFSQDPKSSHDDGSKPLSDDGKKFWSTAMAKTINGEAQLHAYVDGKKIIITEASIRRDLQLADEEGVDCLPNSTIFEQLALMGEYVADKDVHKELRDSLVRATTSASSLEAEQDNGGEEVFVAEQEVIKDVNENVVEEVYMLVEKTKPLTSPTLSMMLEKKLQIDYQSEMAYQLLKLIKKQLKKIKSLLDAVEITAAQVFINTALMKLVLLRNFKKIFKVVTAAGIKVNASKESYYC